MKQVDVKIMEHKYPSSPFGYNDMAGQPYLLGLLCRAF